MLTPDIQLIKDAFTAIESIPDEAISLAQWRTQEGRSLTTGTICCPAGWLTLHPKFVAKGLTFDGRGRPAYGIYRGYAALAVLFKIDTEEALAMFCPVPERSWSPLSDKTLWLNRVRTYLQRNAHKYPY